MLTSSRTWLACLVLSAAAACGTPENSPVMQPGEACIGCHTEGGTASSLAWTAAGTVFPEPTSATTEGFEGVKVQLTDSDGKVVTRPR